MPNFNTHWLVALNSIEATLPWFGKGLKAYFREANRFSNKVRSTIIRSTTRTNIKTEINSISKSMLIDIQHRSDHQDMCAFSAFMCGACGPDFWVVPYNWALGIPTVKGEHHFDLGHYNRTHQQFIISINRLKNSDKNSFKSKLEMAYFTGMATHIAADTIIHQLVNRYAGAYNLIHKNWTNEMGHCPVPLWSSHNKVEHYWDSYVRLRYLGDYGRVFNSFDTENWFEPLNLPVVETLMRDTAKLCTAGPKVADEIREDLDNDEVRAMLETFLNFPFLFADQAIKDHTLSQFLREIIIDKKIGAYPQDVVNKAVCKEGDVDEKRKLEFFSSKLNHKVSMLSNSYLNYYICPGLERLQKHGLNIFYDFDALKPFIERAIIQAKVFVEELTQAYTSNSPDKLKYLTNFWNLDTGLGLRVIRRKSDTSKEVITRLEFAHVLDPDRGKACEPLVYPDKSVYRLGRSSEEWKIDKARIFPTKKVDPVPTLFDVIEPDDCFLEKISLQRKQAEVQSSITIDDKSFFSSKKPPLNRKVVIEKDSQKQTVIQIRQIAHRLNLEIGVAIARLGSDSVGFFLHSDKKGVRDDFDGSAKDWIAKAQVLDYGQAEQSSDPGLAKFDTRLLMNLNVYKNLPSQSALWNNVIPYDRYYQYYGRNFAISTGRSGVLTSNNIALGKNFEPRKDYRFYTNVSPTEQIFFSLHPLVSTPAGVFDVLSRKKIEPGELSEIRKIQSIGFVKIVLYYELQSDGSACQLAECYIDGLRIPVEEEKQAEVGDFPVPNSKFAVA